jgi:hypothetical protein
LDISEEKEEAADRVIKANPIPHLGISFQPKLEHKYTVPAPFSFASKDKERFQAKEENIKKIIEEESKVRNDGMRGADSALSTGRVRK